MSELTALETARRIAGPIGEIGGKWMLSPEVLGPSKDYGYPNGFAYYAVGRGGVLGDVDAGVVIAAFGFFEPGLVRKMWDIGAAVEGPRASARRYGQACAEFGREHLSEFANADRFVELADHLVDGASVVGLPLFAGWRAEQRPRFTAGRAYFLAHVLREWRGSAHVVAAAASGLSPLEAILTQGGVDRAKMFGWGESFDDVGHLVDQRADAELSTDRICAAALDSLFTAAERGEFADLVDELKASFVA